MILALQEVTIFTAELQKAAARVEQIICKNIQKAVIACAVARANIVTVVVRAIAVTSDSPLVSYSLKYFQITNFGEYSEVEI
jgi:hypothetical protein